tara:strand:+ start:218 stop:493 length:276 start_codon:yes stop_codon:yes gene_type:complete
MMTEYGADVERQRNLLEAEEWAKGIKTVHVHRMKSMWYDDRPKDTDKNHVTDVQYNDGRIIRSKQGKEIHTWNNEVKQGDDLIAAYFAQGK